MGVRSIKMPDVGEGVAEAEIVEWAVKVGDLVKEDQVVAAVMTDKATVEIPTPVAGSVLALGGAVGEVLAVGSELIRIDAPGLPDSVGARRAEIASASARGRAVAKRQAQTYRTRAASQRRRGRRRRRASRRSQTSQRRRARPSPRQARRALRARSRSPRPRCA